MKKTLGLATIAIIVFAVALMQPHSARAYYTQDLVVNGGFENDPLGTGWEGDTFVVGDYPPVVWHSGSRGAFIANTSSGSNLLYQNIQLPSNATSVTFSAWYQFWSDETGSSTDLMAIEIRNSDDLSDVWFSQVLEPNVNETGPSWTKLTGDITAHKGQTGVVILWFQENGVPYSWGFVDDVSVIVEKPDVTVPTTILSSVPSAPNGSNSFFTSVPMITLSSSDDVGGSSVNKTLYNWDGGSYVEYTSPIIAPHGTHTLYYYSSDKAGNNETPNSTVFKVDMNAPSTSFVSSPSTPNGSNSFYTSIPSITLSASDDTNGSGVSKTFYNWDGGSYVEYSGPINAPQGTHTLYYYSSDTAGNNEAAKTAVFKVDTNKPSVNAALSIATPDGANGWYKTAPTITLSASDGSDGSGIDVIRYRWDGGGNVVYAGALGASEGVHTLLFSVVDKAGNNSDEASVVIKVDATDLVLTLLDSNYQQTVNTASVLVKGAVIDNGSGIASVTVNDVLVAPDSSGNFSAKVDLKQGNNVITVIATDNAGRSVSASRTVVYKKGQVLGDSVVRPIIKKISPKSTTGVEVASTNQKVKVIGINFKKGAKVKVGKLSIKKVTYKNRTFVEITIPVSKLKKGKHDVTITNPDGQTMTMKKGFTKT